MLFWKKLDVADNQRVLLYHRKRLAQVLGPGRHSVPRLGGPRLLETYDINDVEFDNPSAKSLLVEYNDMLAPYVEHFEVTDEQVGLVYRDGHLSDILRPGTFKAYWKGVETIAADIIDTSERYQISEKLLGKLGRGLNAALTQAAFGLIQYTEVPDEHVGVLKVNGKFERMLTAGRYGFWKVQRQVEVKLIDLRLQTMEVSGQEILTKDRVSLRLNLTAAYRVVDPQAVLFKVNDADAFVYRELQLALRESVGAQSLDALLEDKDSLNQHIAARVKQRFVDYGIALSNVGVKDIILPGDMKMILNKVVEAQKVAEANLINRREETQAMRSLHNTAKMMENNPILLRLKELEALERITERVGEITVYGGLDAVMNDLVRLAPKFSSGNGGH
ncbi:MAG: slipin family protein [Pseudomonadales bacterium]|nr:slipin family protein [Pseudomonadales bacterium]